MSIHQRKIYITWTVAILLVSSSTALAEMIILSSQRRVSGDATQQTLLAASTEELGVFTEDLLSSGYVRDGSNRIVGSVSASASQSSTLTGNRIRGLGRGSGFASGPAFGIGLTEMIVQFEVDTPTQFTLSGQLRIAPHGRDLALNDSLAYIRLTGPNGLALEVMLSEDALPNSLGVVDFSGRNRLIGEVLPPGLYTLEAVSEGHGSEGLTRCADFDFTLEAAAIPEPTALSICVFGFPAISLLRRRGRANIASR